MTRLRPHHRPITASTAQIDNATIDRGDPRSLSASPSTAASTVDGTSPSAVPSAKSLALTDVTPAP